MTPYYYANAADIFSSGEISMMAAGIGLGVCVLSVGIGGIVYARRDIAA